MKDLTEQVQRMHRFFNTRQTLDIKMRLYFLKKLKAEIIRQQDTICNVLSLDFNKPLGEAYMAEVYTVLQELDYVLKNLTQWARPQKEISMMPTLSRFYVTPEPYGVCAVIAPYNYPFNLSIIPLIGAIAAGNCVIVKPAETTPHTTHFIKTLLSSVFPSHLVYTLVGDASVGERLLKQPLDYIFFTGSTHVGKAILKEAASNLIPVTLELGGKNPTIVDAHADLKLAAKRIAWGKFLNGGQTCVAPDYLLVHESVVEPFLTLLKQEIKRMFSTKDQFPRMIHDAHYIHVLHFLDEDKIYYGGHFDADACYIEPTILYPASLKDACMQEEIFGPILPVIPFTKLSSCIEIIRRFPKPLACYIFSKDKLRTNYLLRHITFGGGAVNDTLMHLNNPKVPFGGVGYSGMGHYHGKYSFDTFSHYKTILKSTPFELPLRYPPYTHKIDFIKRYTNLKFK